MLEYAWYFEDDELTRMVRVVNRGAHAALVEFSEQGVTWQILVSNDDIEFIGDDRVDYSDED